MPARFGTALLVLSLTACHPSAATERSLRVYRAREAATANVNSATALDLAKVIHANHVAGHYRANFAQHVSDTYAVLQAMDRLQGMGLETEEILAWRGIVLTDAGRGPEAREAFVASFAGTPNYLAGRALVLMYARDDSAEMVTSTCNTAYAVLEDLTERLGFITLCESKLKLLTPGRELAWLDDDSRAWFHREHERVTRREADRAVAIAAARARAHRVARYMQRCTPSCEKTGTACQAACRSGDASCIDTCQTTYGACFSTCESSAMKAVPAT